MIQKKVKGQRKTYHPESELKKAEVGLLMSGEVDLIIIHINRAK